MDWKLAMATAGTIAALVGAASAATSTGLALSKGSPKMPKLPQPVAPPPAPPPPAPPPPAAIDTGAAAAVSEDKRKRKAQYGIANTILANPLGGSGTATSAGSTLLGG